MKELAVYFNSKYYIGKHPKTMIWVTKESLPQEYIFDLRKKYKQFLKSDNSLFIIYTKSDFIIRELSNMIIAYNILKNTKAKESSKIKVLEKKYDFDLEHYAINPENIKCFKRDMSQYEITKEQGIFCTDLDFGIDMQNEMQGTLFELTLRSDYD